MRVLLADDDPHVRSAVRLLLQQEPGICLVAECATADGLLEQVTCTSSDVLLLDWDLPGLHMRGDIKCLRRRAPSCHVVALSGRPEERADALQAGACHFVSKGDSPDSLLAVLRSLVTRKRC